MRVLDPAEIDFAFKEPALFHDLESGRELYVDPQAARQQYLERFAAHSAAVSQACSQLGIDEFRLPTDRPLELALFDFLARGCAAAVRQRAGNRAAAAPQEAADGLLHLVYLGGLAAISLPLLFHLIRRTPRGRQAFSSLMFLSPSPPRLTRRSRLDHSALVVRARGHSGFAGLRLCPAVLPRVGLVAAVRTAASADRHPARRQRQHAARRPSAPGGGESGGSARRSGPDRRRGVVHVR